MSKKIIQVHHCIWKSNYFRCKNEYKTKQNIIKGLPISVGFKSRSSTLWCEKWLHDSKACHMCTLYILITAKRRPENIMTYISLTSIHPSVCFQSIKVRRLSPSETINWYYVTVYSVTNNGFILLYLYFILPIILNRSVPQFKMVRFSSKY